MTTTSVEELQAELAAVRLERDRARSLLRAAAADLDAAGRSFLASNYRRHHVPRRAASESRRSSLTLSASARPGRQNTTGGPSFSG